MANCNLAVTLFDSKTKAKKAFLGQSVLRLQGTNALRDGESFTLPIAEIEEGFRPKDETTFKDLPFDEPTEKLPCKGGTVQLEVLTFPLGTAMCGEYIGGCVATVTASSCSCSSTSSRQWHQQAVTF